MRPDELLDKAERALASADLLLSAGDPEGACNRAYYAMFDSARAALLQIAPSFLEIKTHGGLISAFSKHLVKTGHIPVALGKALNATEDMRVAADYKSAPIHLDNAAWAVAEAHRFVIVVSVHGEPRQDLTPPTACLESALAGPRPSGYRPCGT